MNPTENNETQQYSVFIKTLAGKVHEISTSGKQRVLDLKESIHRLEGISVSSQRLIFDGQQLKDNKTLSDYNIREQAEIHLILTLMGMMIPENGKHNFDLRQ
eukprot:TRINITY_DN22359_c0_g1_i1.p1 TRINITY_DN22359_c0_g1~~TRINITY_DN22359_c0_g1_i1.p1  ORF type:complete len:102 (+),score=10.72 TRINITY_DN22359_c0_g1_i1:62-367(+)